MWSVYEGRVGAGERGEGGKFNEEAKHCMCRTSDWTCNSFWEYIEIYDKAKGY